MGLHPRRATLPGEGTDAADANGRRLMTAERVDVCICTFKRASISDAIASLSKQILPPGVSLRVIVADNDAQPSARERVLAAAAAHDLDLVYVHAPAQNISIARNACVAASDSAWFAFIDDDETAAPDWLGRLLTARADADVVFGVARAIYADSAPVWMVRGDFHSNDLGREKRIVSGYTSNVLIRRAAIEAHGLRFDPALGKIGGEDTIFFYDLHQRGARLSFAPEAVVYEEVGAGRQNLKWVLRRRYRAGQTHAHLMRRFHADKALPTTALAALKTAYCALLALVTAPFPTLSVRHFSRAVFHAGVVHFFMRPKFYAEYARPSVN